MHNDSATRSRSKLSAMLDELFGLVPLIEYRGIELAEGKSIVSRADRVALVVIYIKKLQAEHRMLEKSFKP
jgi:hypothetical protein